MSSDTGQPAQPPYPPTTAPLGNTPSPIPDIPISAVLLALFLGGAVTHLTTHIRNNRRPPLPAYAPAPPPPPNAESNDPATLRFLPSLFLAIFSLTRVAALSLRIAWAARPRDATLALASTVLTSAGVLILFLVNLVLARRVVRALQPSVGWSKALGTWGFRAVVGSVLAVLVMVVLCSAHGVFTLDSETRARESEVLLFAGVWITLLGVLPGVMVLWARVVKTVGPHGAERFGKGGMGMKVALVVVTSVLLTLGAGWRVGVNFRGDPVGQPRWYHSRAAFYCVNFGVELVVVYTLAIFRFDKRFRIPAGCTAPGHYSKGGPNGVSNEVSEQEERLAGSPNGVAAEADVHGNGQGQSTA